MTTSRADRLRVEAADLERKKRRRDPEQLLQVLGVVLMVVGVVVAFTAYRSSLIVKATPGTNVDILTSNAYLPLAMTGLAVSVVGGFVFLRYSVAKALRSGATS